jgi:hypothetical protein
MKSTRRSTIADFGTVYKHPQAVRFEDRVPYILDREFYVGIRPSSLEVWKHAIAAVVFVLILVVAIVGTGHAVEVFR